MASIFDNIFTNDGTVRRWKQELIETQNMMKSMQNELEMEKAKETLLLTELRGKILQIDHLTLGAGQLGNERLQTLMVNQMAEVNKSEVLANVQEENLRQCLSFMKEVSEWKLSMPGIPQTAPQSSTPGIPQTAPQSSTPGIPHPAPVSRPTNSITEGKEIEKPSEEERLLVEDIHKIEETIAECEKEHAELKEFMIDHHKFLQEMDSDAKTNDCPKESRKFNTEEIISTKNHNSISRDQTSSGPLQQILENQERTQSPVTQIKVPVFASVLTVNHSLAGNKIRTRKFEAKSAIISTKVQNEAGLSEMLKKGTSEGVDNNLHIPSTLTNEHISCQPAKKRLDLYDNAVQRSLLTTLVKENSSQRKPTAPFKPKMPSTLRKRIN